MIDRQIWVMGTELRSSTTALPALNEPLSHAPALGAFFKKSHSPPDTSLCTMGHEGICLFVLVFHLERKRFKDHTIYCKVNCSLDLLNLNMPLLNMSKAWCSVGPCVC